MKIQTNQTNPDDMRVIDKNGNVLGYIMRYIQYGNEMYRASCTIEGTLRYGNLNSLSDAMGFIISERGIMTFTEWENFRTNGNTDERV